jgi:hypothetical protein
MVKGSTRTFFAAQLVVPLRNARRGRCVSPLSLPACSSKAMISRVDAMLQDAGAIGITVTPRCPVSYGHPSTRDDNVLGVPTHPQTGDWSLRPMT